MKRIKAILTYFALNKVRVFLSFHLEQKRSTENLSYGNFKINRTNSLCFGTVRDSSVLYVCNSCTQPNRYHL